MPEQSKICVGCDCVFTASTARVVRCGKCKEDYVRGQDANRKRKGKAAGQVLPQLVPNRLTWRDIQDCSPEKMAKMLKGNEYQIVPGLHRRGECAQTFNP